MNHVEKAQSRILWQYRNSPKFIAWISTLPAIAKAKLEAPLQVIADILDIDNIQGDQLDVVGRIVGIKRDFQKILADSGTGYDEDEVFRFLIKAKVVKNTSEATIDGIAEALNIIVESNSVTIQDSEDMTFSVAFSSELSNFERFILNTFDVLPRPQGVKFLGFTESPLQIQFGGVTAIFGDPRAQFTDPSFGV